MDKQTNYTKQQEIDFIESLYNEANEQLKEIYSEQKNNKDDLLKEIALVLLIYNISNNIMKLSDVEKTKLNSKFLSLITRLSKRQVKLTNKVITDILINTTKNTYDFYGQKYTIKNIEDIVNRKFKGKVYTQRIIDNENEIANHLNDSVQSFIDGGIDVNSIKDNIEKTFNQNAYNVRVLGESETNRSENDTFIIIAKANGVKKVIRHEILDDRICLDCEAIAEEIFDIDEAPEIMHPLCRGWNSVYE